MSRVCIVANQINHVHYDCTSSYIGVDGGALYCMNHKIAMNCAIGDFDSITKEELMQLKACTKVIQLPSEKDQVDSECALLYANQYYDEIDLYGVTGGRLDHFMIVYQLLKKGEIPFRIIDEQNIIQLLKPGKHEVRKENKYISFYPLEPQKLSLDGFKYNVSNEDVDEYSLYLSSNEITGDIAFVDNGGRIIVMQTGDNEKR